MLSKSRKRSLYKSDPPTWNVRIMVAAGILRGIGSKSCWWAQFLSEFPKYQAYILAGTIFKFNPIGPFSWKFNE